MSLIEDRILTMGSSPSIKDALPVRAEVSITKYGMSHWTSTFKIDTTENTGEKNRYFLKCAYGHKGKMMMRGEFDASNVIYKVTPQFCPRPIATGTFAELPDVHYYICEFMEMEPESTTKEPLPPNPVVFCENLANLHQKATSPNGMFGFHVPTCNGWIPQLNNWERSWMTFFRNGFLHLLDLHCKNQNGIDHFEQHREQFLGVVIPRLLSPLETDGNSIQPCLVHGDLWHGNTATTKEHLPIIFDPASFYAHHEYELGNWRPLRNKFTEEYFIQYHRHIPQSQPKEEFDDRNRLYSMRFNLHAAILFPTLPEYREFVIDDMVYLIKKYGCRREKALEEI